MERNAEASARNHVGAGFFKEFVAHQIAVLNSLDSTTFSQIVDELERLRERGGRLFFVGSGGGAGHSSHASADFRRLCGIESYAVGDNVSELTALVNDTSWADAYRIALEQSRFSKDDGIFVFSVGGGDAEKSVSPNLVEAVKYAKSVGGTVMGVVGSPGGFLASTGLQNVLVVEAPSNLKTPTVEGIQAVVWHALVSDPRLQIRRAHWENLLEA